MEAKCVILGINSIMLHCRFFISFLASLFFLQTITMSNMFAIRSQAKLVDHKPSKEKIVTRRFSFKVVNVQGFLEINFTLWPLDLSLQARKIKRLAVDSLKVVSSKKKTKMDVDKKPCMTIGLFFIPSFDLKR